MKEQSQQYQSHSEFESSFPPFYVNILHSYWVTQANLAFGLCHQVQSFKPRTATLLILCKRKQDSSKQNMKLTHMISEGITYCIPLSQRARNLNKY